AAARDRRKRSRHTDARRRDGRGGAAQLSTLAVPGAVLALLVAVPLVIAVDRRGGTRTAPAWVAAGAMVAALALLAPFVPAVLAGERFFFRLPWLPEFGLDLAFRLDGLGAMFAALILGIGLLVVLYAAYYFPPGERLGRFYALLSVFAAGMLGLVLS